MRIVVGITGATGVLYGVRLLRALGDLGVESHLVMSRWAEATILKETSFSLRQVRDLAFAVHGRDDMGAAISSGSFRHDGMVIVPCSMKTLSAVRHGHSDTLIARAADVSLKERRRLVLAGARDAAERDPPGEHAGLEPDGCHRRSRGPGLLQRTSDHRRSGRSLGRADP